ncbi:MAG: hypothetical protein PVH45_05365 [Candidatus Omnitrophota bacterium]|jgi:hypothetical protein
MKLTFLQLSILALITAINTYFGFFLFLKPDRVIELQKKFYLSINWRMEPISMPKEIRNTRAMGMFLIALTLVIIVFAVMARQI